MASKKLVLLCTLLAGAGLAFAQSAAPSDAATGVTTVVQNGTAAVPQGTAQAVSRMAGEDYATAIEVFGEKAGETCPPNYLAGLDLGGSTWFYSDHQFCTGGSCSRVRCEHFPAPGQTITKPVGIITWHGCYLDSASNGTDKLHRFRLRFFPDTPAGTGPDPNQVLYNEWQVVTSVDTGNRILFTGGSVPAIEWKFTFVMTTPLTITAGWFSVQGDDPNSTNAYHLWGPSTQGDFRIWQWWETPFTGYQSPGLSIDLNYCLNEKRVGACCNDCTRTCTDNVWEQACLDAGHYFLYNQPCTAVNPACGEGTGACCHEDGTCVTQKAYECQSSCVGPSTYCRGDCNCDGNVNFGDINPFVLKLSDPNGYHNAYPTCPVQNTDLNADGVTNFSDINPFVACLSAGGGNCAAHPPHGPCSSADGPRAEGSVWAGRGTLCTDPNACCQIQRPAGSVLEGETVCSNGYVDTFNNGCSTFPAQAHYSSITCGSTVYGNAGTYTLNNAQVRDTDWYTVTSTPPQGNGVVYTITVSAEFPVTVSVAGSGTCDPNDTANNYYIVATGSAARCTPLTVQTRILPGGTYWIIVTPSVFTGVLCGSDYTLQLACDTTQPLCIVSPPSNPIMDCDEPCAYGGTDCNGGCNVTPNAFQTITFDPNGTAEIYGTIWAKNGTRDLDWYKFTTTSPKITEVWFEAEFSGMCGMLTGADATPPHTGAPTCSDGVWSCGAYAPCSGLSLCNFDVLPAGYYWPVVLIQDANGAIFDGYPCYPAGTPGNHYHVRLRSYVNNCPTLIDCSNQVVWGRPEGEPNCTGLSSWVDSYNNGCDGPSTPHFLTTSCDDRVCGALANWTDPNNNPKSDTDWYAITVTGPTQYTVTITAELPTTFQLWKPGTGNSCTGAVLLETYDIPSCGSPLDITLIHCLPAGTFWFRFAPTTALFPAPCTGTNYPLNYSFWVSACNTCTQCTVTCPGGSVAEGETCGSDTNGGCNSTPPIFGTITCGETICGNTWANAGTRDTDWYKLTLTSQIPQATCSLDTEVPVLLLFITGTNLGHPSCTDEAGWQITGIGPCNGGSPMSPFPGPFPAGEYWLIVAPADSSGNGIFSNYPCNGGANTYWLRLACQ